MKREHDRTEMKVKRFFADADSIFVCISNLLLLYLNAVKHEKMPLRYHYRFMLTQILIVLEKYNNILD